MRRARSRFQTSRAYSYNNLLLVTGSFMTEKSIQDEVNRLVALKLDSITESLMAKVEMQLLVLLKKAAEPKK